MLCINLSEYWTTLKGKASSIHKEITTIHFVKMLHFMLDLLDVITETSKIFQRENLVAGKSNLVVQPLYHTKKKVACRNCWKMQSHTSTRDLITLTKLLSFTLRSSTSSSGHIQPIHPTRVKKASFESCS